jgi:hypothetical protein
MYELGDINDQLRPFLVHDVEHYLAMPLYGSDGYILFDGIPGVTGDFPLR